MEIFSYCTGPLMAKITTYMINCGIGQAKRLQNSCNIFDNYQQEHQNSVARPLTYVLVNIIEGVSTRLVEVITIAGSWIHYYAMGKFTELDIMMGMREIGCHF
jgi:hypothetical protein